MLDSRLYFPSTHRDHPNFYQPINYTGDMTLTIASKFINPSILETLYVKHNNNKVVVDNIIGLLGKSKEFIDPSISNHPSLTPFLINYGGSDELVSTTSSLIPTDIPAEGKAVILMAISMSLHYFAYSLARPTTLSLFVSSEIGFGKSTKSAFPLAMAFISPVSLLLLMYYGYELNTYGPMKALQHTTFFCSSMLIACSSLITFFQKNNMNILNIPVVKIIVGILFIFRESYVQLITSQMWSFMSSVLTPTQSSKWFSRISALTSFMSIIAGLGLSSLIKNVGLVGVVAFSGVSLILSTFFSKAAYKVANEHGFDPSKEHDKRKQKKQEMLEVATMNNSNYKEQNMVRKAADLFARVPTLGALFFEIVACQGLSTLINVVFVTKLKESIPDDSLRAGWTGKFFSLVNVFSSILQIGILPFVTPRVEPSLLWRGLPSIMIAILINQSLHAQPSLFIISASLLAMKSLEFSVRRMLDELVYVPLDFESRFIGKEVISVFGYRFGKSLTSLVLSGVTTFVARDFGLQEMSYITTSMALLWGTRCFRLSNFVLTRKEADEAYKKNRESSKDEK